MKSVRVAFKIVDYELTPVGHQEMGCHMVFDVKMEANFHHEALLVAGGHAAETPQVSTYAIVVLRKTVRIALTCAASNDLEVKGAWQIRQLNFAT